LPASGRTRCKILLLFRPGKVSQKMYAEHKGQVFSASPRQETPPPPGTVPGSHARKGYKPHRLSDPESPATSLSLLFPVLCSCTHGSGGNSGTRFPHNIFPAERAGRVPDGTHGRCTFHS